MERSSRQVTSNQPGVHPGLGRLVRRHKNADWRKPAQEVDLPALRILDEALDRHRGPLVLDSFCGTGHSTAKLAEHHPDALVIGVDKSAHRLRRSPPQGANGLLLHANCEAIWRHLADRRHTLSHHYLLYPNPWPKAAHLKRRIHGHPAFTLLPKLGGIMELRSNWQVYVEECGIALHLLGYPSRISCIKEEPAMTLFEEKYRRSGHDLWRLSADLNKA